MALSKEEILDAIASMSVLEVSELIKMMGRKNSVFPLLQLLLLLLPLPVALLLLLKKKSEFDVVLKEIGANKVQVIKLSVN